MKWEQWPLETRDLFFNPSDSIGQADSWGGVLAIGPQLFLSLLLCRFRSRTSRDWMGHLRTKRRKKPQTSKLGPSPDTLTQKICPVISMAMRVLLVTLPLSTSEALLLAETETLKPASWDHHELNGQCLSSFL